MNFYRTILDSSLGGPPQDYSHHTTLSEAHNAAKGYQSADRDRIFVELINVPTDKAGILSLLQGYALDDFKPDRNWKLTRRGALEEFPVES
jgi:hypothetical protein